MSDRKKVLELFEEQKDFYEETVNAGIEKYRKGNGKISVTDKNGNPVTDARIRIRQKSHEFRFGINLFLLDEMETDEKQERYKEYVAGTFNMATLPFYWDALESERGKPRYAKDSPKCYRRPAIDTCLEFCEENGIEPREHGLAYEKFYPKWLYDADIPEIKAELERRFSEISQRYAHKIRTIEVTNEMNWAKGSTVFYDDPEYVEWCFKLAEKYFPDNQLVINEATGRPWGDKCRATDMYYAYIEANMLKGARIDAVGMQYHMFYRAEDEYEKTRPYYDPKNLYKHMDLYSNFKKPLQVTEVTVPAYSNDPEDEELQAEILGKLYPIWFSHPNVEQIIYWNLIDGYAHFWNPDPARIKASLGDMTLGENYYYGGLVRFDMTPKPAYYTIRDLIQKTWHTETKAATDARGNACFRGFYGEYELEITGNGETVTKNIMLSSKENNEYTVTLG